MHDSKRAADDVEAIRDSLAIMAAQRLPKRTGSPCDHCGHCPHEPDETCQKNCKNEAISQGWYTPETFGS